MVNRSVVSRHAGGGRCKTSELIVMVLGSMAVVFGLACWFHPGLYQEVKLLKLIPRTSPQPGLPEEAATVSVEAGNGERISGYATQQGTAAFHKRFPKHFPRIDLNTGLTLSSIGIGTYLGAPTDEVDKAVEQAVVDSVMNGVNVIDSAINYRGMRGEKSVGRALRRLLSSGVGREEIFVATKAGFIPTDSANSRNSQRVVADWAAEFGRSFPLDEIVDKKHCIAPACLDISIRTSLENLGLSSLDLVYLHNVGEKQGGELEIREVYGRIGAAFQRLEDLRKSGVIRFYGVATWTSFREAAEQTTHLDLSALVELAITAGGQSHGFKFIQLPVPPSMPEAVLSTDQNNLSFVQLARQLNLTIMSSRSVSGGTSKYDATDTTQQFYTECLEDPEVIAALALESSQPLSKHAVKGVPLLLQLTRSVPEVTTALVGMKESEHVKENLKMLSRPLEHAAMVTCVYKKWGEKIGRKTARKGGEGKRHKKKLRAAP